MWEWCFNNFSRGGISGWMGGGLMMLFPILIIVLIFYLFEKREKNSTTGTDTPLDILKKRYARGEITKEEFDEIKKDLQ